EIRGSPCTAPRSTRSRAPKHSGRVRRRYPVGRSLPGRSPKDLTATASTPTSPKSYTPTSTTRPPCSSSGGGRPRMGCAGSSASNPQPLQILVRHPTSSRSRSRTGDPVMRLVVHSERWWWLVGEWVGAGLVEGFGVAGVFVSGGGGDGESPGFPVQVVGPAGKVFGVVVSVAEGEEVFFGGVAVFGVPVVGVVEVAELGGAMTHR